jgi:hypothetical protein
LVGEIDEFCARLKIDPSSVTLTFPSNKVYVGVTVQNMHGTLGELAAEIVDANIDMWHLQEINYDKSLLESYTKEQMLNYLISAARLNIERNEAIDRFDRELACTVS